MTAPLFFSGENPLTPEKILCETLCKTQDFKTQDTRPGNLKEVGGQRSEVRGQGTSMLGVRCSGFSPVLRGSMFSPVSSLSSSVLSSSVFSLILLCLVVSACVFPSSFIIQPSSFRLLPPSAQQTCGEEQAAQGGAGLGDGGPVEIAAADGEAALGGRNAEVTTVDVVILSGAGED
jgi:hypothetical protein